MLQSFYHFFYIRHSLIIEQQMPMAAILDSSGIADMELEVRILLPKLVMILWFDEPDLKWQIFDSVKQKLVFDIPFL